jgi:hypothetical protein
MVAYLSLFAKKEKEREEGEMNEKTRKEKW